MQRQTIAPRAQWEAALDDYAYGPAARPAAGLWDESAYYRFSAAEIDRIEAVANELYAMVVEAVGHVVDRRLYGLLGLDPAVAKLVEKAWSAFRRGGATAVQHSSLLTRLDLAQDAQGDIKLLGCHADGPGGLFTTSIVQWNWKEARFPDADQFNGLHEATTARLQRMSAGVPGRQHLHLACATPDAPRQGELAYFAALAEEASIDTTVMGLQDIGWDGHRFRDLDDAEMRWLFKLYPWEALMADAYGQHLPTAGMDVLEPAWTLLASNHGLLSVLWELYPEHPNLLPASLTEGDLAGKPLVERRSLLGLDRPARRLTRGGTVVYDTGAAVNPGGYVYLAPAPAAGVVSGAAGRTAVLQVWIVGDSAYGMGVRESRDPVIDADAAMVPHLFT